MPTRILRNELTSIDECTDIDDKKNAKFLLFIGNKSLKNDIKQMLSMHSRVICYNDKQFMNRELKTFADADNKSNILYFNASKKSDRDYLQKNLKKSHPYKIIVLFKKNKIDRLIKDDWTEHIKDGYDALVVRVKSFMKLAETSLGFDEFFNELCDIGDKIAAPAGACKKLFKLICSSKN